MAKQTSNLGSTLSPAIADNVLGQDMNLINASSYQGVKLVLADDGSEHCVMTKLTFIKFIPGWIELKILCWELRHIVQRYIKEIKFKFKFTKGRTWLLVQVLLTSPVVKNCSGFSITVWLRDLTVKQSVESNEK